MNQNQMVIPALLALAALTFDSIYPTKLETIRDNYMNQLGIACAWVAIFEAFRRWMYYIRGLYLAETPVMREAFTSMNEWRWPDICNEALETLERHPISVPKKLPPICPRCQHQLVHSHDCLN